MASPFYPSSTPLHNYYNTSHANLEIAYEAQQPLGITYTSILCQQLFQRHFPLQHQSIDLQPHHHTTKDQTSASHITSNPCRYGRTQEPPTNYLLLATYRPPIAAYKPNALTNTSDLAATTTTT
ncbi:hypothetical protein KC19_VG097300 [Ceratodon purpureus]|uniref:Uncharacterized protein n=1 Tax=Ceratodon purpureus TaxID=3225 RepID=A0A8T0HNT9_CERPU|nr:hypothetical protein KC19_VG097300 [Ceratodon purpureus]